MNSEIHQPILLKEVLHILNPQPGKTYIDATINGGGHAAAIIERIQPAGKLLGIDRDYALLAESARAHPELKQAGNILVCDSFMNIHSIAESNGFLKADGILFDLGFSSYHIERSGRGFSFLRNEPLDMRYDPGTHDLTAQIIINTWSEQAIEDVLRRGGEERFARRISRAIVRRRAQCLFKTTDDLVAIIRQCLPARFRTSRLHPATKVFQSLRIEVNGELNHLQKGLEGAWQTLGIKGRCVAISFHSLEDRIVKSFFVGQERQKCARIITKKPVRASEEEKINNPRARSAKLRAAEKLIESGLI